MPSILSKSGMNNLPLVMADHDNRIGAQIELIVEELKAHYSRRGIEHDDPNVMMEQVASKLGSKFEGKLFGDWIGMQNLHAAAAFALGYYTAKYPEWLMFEAHSMGEGGVE